MNIDFIVEQDFSNNQLVIRDNTRPTTVMGTTDDITSLVLTVTSDKLLSDKSFDCREYVIQYKKDRELYVILPEDLELTKFEDGLYTFSLSTNNSTPITYSYIFYHNLLEGFEEKAEALGYEVEISSYDYIQYVNDDSKSFLEEIRIAGACIDELKNQRYKDKSLVEVTSIVNDLLFKSNRILEIINI